MTSKTKPSPSKEVKRKSKVGKKTTVQGLENVSDEDKDEYIVFLQRCVGDLQKRISDAYKCEFWVTRERRETLEELRLLREELQEKDEKISLHREEFQEKDEKISLQRVKIKKLRRIIEKLRSE